MEGSESGCGEKGILADDTRQQSIADVVIHDYSYGMGQAASIDGLTKSQKIQLMEALWDDLCRNDTDMRSPDWHERVLEARQARVDRGEATFRDWDEAKKHIRDITS